MVVVSSFTSTMITWAANTSRSYASHLTHESCHANGCLKMDRQPSPASLAIGSINQVILRSRLAHVDFGAAIAGCLTAKDASIVVNHMPDSSKGRARTVAEESHSQTQVIHRDGKFSILSKPRGFQINTIIITTINGNYAGAIYSNPPRKLNSQSMRDRLV